MSALAKMIFTSLMVLAIANGDEFKLSPPWITSSPTDDGDHYETYDVPNPIAHCMPGGKCVGLWFTFKLAVPMCIRFRDIWVRRADGSDVPFRFYEIGERGEPGYVWNVETPGDAAGSGRLTLHYTTERCPVTS